MKAKLLSAALIAAALLTGCAAMDSLIFHPIHILVQQHKSNQDAKWNEDHAWINWPTNR